MAAFKQYACLVEPCSDIFETWGAARQHMKKCGFQGKPKLQESAEKALRLSPKAVPVPTMKPWEGVSEEELIQIVEEFYACGPATVDYRKDVMARAIRPKYGDFPFAKFGFGTFLEFSERNGLSTRSTRRFAPY
mmetsp:Transcript_110206/g.235305  ORF Transcript_110206/g.235305 Transcript_110206/m.235305 type:complete len:134 (-) Transcript_110206:110-511(-)|eukprot:CAMPEP_0180474212 /NCGR_PEP_ID=MMETSP1036_2-20121128/30559_1 /TAXON_ID=632150 /ORGANISM="Azadinium spinosum, Strain 3D9" /LENGTH=133 /DNA_ID=CAMNT_0022481519 /DNA_START=37 /DNA_END=438 /DNA_ORIENTATION=+